MKTFRIVVLLALLPIGAFLAKALYRTGHLRFAHPSPQEYPISGIDVSHHQKRIDWDLVADAGIDFAFLKATASARATEPVIFRHTARCLDRP